MVSTAARSSRTSSRSSRTEVSVDASCAQAGESRDMTSSPEAREYGLLILDPHFLMLSIQATGELTTAATRYDARRAGDLPPCRPLFLGRLDTTPRGSANRGLADRGSADRFSDRGE